MKRIIMTCSAVLLLFVIVSSAHSASENGFIMPEVPFYVAGYDFGYTDYTKFKITNIEYLVKGNSLGSVNLEIQIDGRKTYDIDGDTNIRFSQIRVELYDMNGIKVANERISTGGKWVGSNLYSASCTFYSLRPGMYTLKFTDSIGESDYSKYLGIWYANDVFDHKAGTIQALGIFEGAIIMVNSDHSFIFSVPGKDTFSGRWDVINDQFYVNGDRAENLLFGNEYLYFTLSDECYLVLSHNQPFKPIPTTIPTKVPTPSPSPTILPIPTPSPSLIISGDVNDDGMVDGRDLIRLARYLAGQDVQIDADASDMNGDSSIDGRDLLRLCKKLAGS